MSKAVPVGAHTYKEKCARELPLTAPALWVGTPMLNHFLKAPSNDPSMMPEEENLFRKEHSKKAHILPAPPTPTPVPNAKASQRS